MKQRRNSSSRSLSLYLKAAILLRSNMKCTYCGRELRKNWHTIDHIDHNPANNATTNLVAACPPCNSSKDSPEMTETFAKHLASLGFTTSKKLQKVIERVQRVAARPITDNNRYSDAVYNLLHDWDLMPRIEYLRAAAIERYNKTRKPKAVLNAALRWIDGDQRPVTIKSLKAAQLLDENLKESKLMAQIREEAEASPF